MPQANADGPCGAQDYLCKCYAQGEPAGLVVFSQALEKARDGLIELNSCWGANTWRLIMARHWVDPKCPLCFCSDQVIADAVNCVVDGCPAQCGYARIKKDRVREVRRKLSERSRGEHAPIKGGGVQLVNGELVLKDVVLSGRHKKD